ncbi:MAG: ChaN family lipoprotein [Desulfuromonadales bacterium]|nr:ChaN family lipoprotein [Desulfuromonadales bacterium]
MRSSTHCKLSPILFLLLFFMTACTMSQQPIGNPEAPYPAIEKPAVGDIYHLHTGVKVTAEQMHAATTDARIVYVGETHDNPAAHRLQLQVLRAMAERYPSQLSLGMETFNTSQQEELDQWVSGELSEKEFLKKSNWFNNWRMDYAYYREILDFAREERIPVIGLNATREMVKKIDRTALDALDEETRKQLPEFDLEDPYQRAMAEAIFADHSSGKAMLDGFLRIQTLWDETMAENIVRAMQDKGSDHRMVVMAGGNHVRYGFGIPRRVYRRLPTSYLLIGSREIVIPEEKQDKLMNVDMPRFPMPPYDYQVYTEYESLPGERVKLGVRMKEEDGKVIVEAVVPNSTADEAGVLAEDIILSLNEILIEDSFDLVYEVNQRVSGDQVTLAIERDGEQLELDVTFIPLPKPDAHGKGKHKK